MGVVMWTGYAGPEWVWPLGRCPEAQVAGKPGPLALRARIEESGLPVLILVHMAITK